MKPKNGRTTNQDYTNLLYSESDSDDPPDLKLPSLNKPKKSRKKRGGNLSLKNTSEQFNDIGTNCSGMTLLKIIVVVVLLAAVAVLGIIMFWLMKQVSALNDKVEGVELQTKKDNEEYSIFQSDFKTLNKSLESIRLENVQLKKNLTELSGKYKLLTDTSSGLKKSLEAIKDLNKLSQIDVLSMTTAQVGSDLKTLESKVKTKMDDINAQILELQKKDGGSREGEMSPSDKSLSSVSPDLAFLSQGLSSVNSDIESLNQTVINTVAMLKQNITTRVGLLEIAISGIIKDVNNLKNKPSSTTVKEATPVDVAGTISDLKVKVSHLTSVLDELQLNHTQISSEHSTMLTSNQSLEFEDLKLQTQNINKTVIRLHQDFDVMFIKVINNTNKVHLVSVAVEGLKSYIADKEKINLPAATNQDVPPGTSTPRPQVNSTSSPVATSEPTTEKTVIKIPGINTYSELQQHYSVWKNAAGGDVALEELKSFMPESQIPSSKDMKPFDKNNDNVYSLQEFSKALNLRPLDSMDFLENRKP